MQQVRHPKPIWKIEVDGNDITSDLSDRLISLNFVDNRGFEADQLDLELNDHDGRLDMPPRKAEIRLALGWNDTGLVDKGTLTVDELEHSGSPDRLTVRARSADLDGGLLTQMERSFHNKTVGDIVRTIAGEAGIKPTIAEVLAGKLIDHIDQTNESSANLLTRMAKQFDAMATVKSGRLLFAPVGAGVSVSGKPLAAVVIDRQAGDSHRFSMADRNSYTAVRANYYNTDSGKKGEVVWSQAEEDAELGKRKPTSTDAGGEYFSVGSAQTSRAKALRLAKKEWKERSKKADFRNRYVGVKVPYNDRVLEVQGEAPYGKADEDKAKASAARRAEQDAEKTGDNASSGIDHSADNAKTLRHVYSSQANAKRAARAEWRQLQRGLASFSITLARALPELIPETPATVRGFKPQIDSTQWIITKVTHSISDAGYTMQIELEIKSTEMGD